MELVVNDDFIVTIEHDQVFLQLRHQGLTLKDFLDLLEHNPRIDVRNFAVVQQALDQVSSQPVLVGLLRSLVECSVSADEMEAKIRIHQTQEELNRNSEILHDIWQALGSQGVCEGILTEVLKEPLSAQRWLVVAQGTVPIVGDNAIVKYIPKPDRKPQLRSDGKTDFYEMNFFDVVHKGDWLGEKIPATPGIPGTTVTGKSVPSMGGKEIPLRYDPKTVMVVQEGDRLVLRAAIDGIVEWQNGRIGVSDCLVISGDVGVGTGNIDYFGSVIVHGTVQDTYSVVAGKDISILSPLGIGAVKRIESKGGDIYLRGGVFGHAKAVIEATGNIFAKYANECVMKAGNDIHIGYYAMGSTLQAKVVKLDEDRGKLIGGKVQAESKVVAAYIGNPYERVTQISIAGFDRELMKESLELMVKERKGVLLTLGKLEQWLNRYESSNQIEEEKYLAKYDSALLTRDHLEGELERLELAIKALVELLKTRGEGAVSISKMAYPKTHLTIKAKIKTVDKETRGTFFYDDGQLYFE